MNSYSLMVVDDEARARAHILEDIPWGTLGVGPLYQAANGLEALNLMVRHCPDIVILDIRMPTLDGVGFLEQLAAMGIHPQVITLSGYSDFEAARKMLSSGLVVEYLLKPASEDQLFEAIYKCIEKIEERSAIASMAAEPKLPENGETSPALEGSSAQHRKKKERESGEGIPVPEGSRGSHAAMVHAVKGYMAAHYAERITLASAAEREFVNAAYLSHIFSEVEGIGFSDYLCQVRIARAKELLENCHLRVYEVAGMVGYQDVKHFLKTFKKHTGVTPSEYRENLLLDF